MAFIVLRRSRNTRSYLLVESYRDSSGKTRKRTLCYLGREHDETDTLDKALDHWNRVQRQLKQEVRNAKGERKQVLRRQLKAAEGRIALIAAYLETLRHRAVAAEAERRRREQLAEEAQHWLAFDRLRRHPTEEHARAAKRAFLLLAKRHHPDQGGRHEDFLRLKEAYDQALSLWRRAA